MRELVLKPIGTVKTDASHEEIRNRTPDIESVVESESRGSEAALDGGGPLIFRPRVLPRAAA